MKIRFLLLVLFATDAAAQLFETIEVRVANVDVVVTDRSGKPALGLTEDDFEVLENGFKQPITNFFEFRGDTNASNPEQRRRIVLFVDQESVDPRRRTEAFAAATRALDKLLRPGDEAMVIASYRDRGVVADLTSDRDAVLRAIQEAANAPVGTPLRQRARDRVTGNALELLSLAQETTRMGAVGLKKQLITMPEAYRSSIASARMQAAEIAAAQRRLLSALRRTLESMAGLEGKKALIYIGGEFQRRPGSDLLESVDSLYRAADPNLMATEGAFEHQDFGPDIERLGATANANGVTLYLLNATDHSSRKGAESAAPIEGTEMLDDIGLNLDSAITMTGLAATTGGRALVASINYDLAFDHVVRDLGSYYSLGYKPSPGAGERTLLVKVKKPGLVVRSRRGYTLKTTDEETNEQLIANAFHPRAASDLDVQLETGVPQPDGEHFLLPVTVRVGRDLATIQKTGEIAIYFVTANLRGDLSPIARDAHVFTFPDGPRPIVYTGSLRVRKGEQLVSVAVVDRVAGRSGFARAKFDTR